MINTQLELEFSWLSEVEKETRVMGTQVLQGQCLCPAIYEPENRKKKNAAKASKRKDIPT